MAEEKKALAYAVAEYLQNELQSAAEDERESLEVAVQCLESCYGFETGEEEARARYSIAPQTLLEVFQKGLGKHRDAATPSPMLEDVPKAPVSDEDKQRADALKNEGNDAVRRGDCRAAVGRYSEAIAVWPDNAVYYVNRAAAYTKLNQLDEAIRDCERGIDIDPNYSKAYSRLGTCYFTQKSYTEAIDAYKKALELEPNNQMYIDNLRAAEKKREKAGSAPATQPARSTGTPSSDLFGSSDFGRSQTGAGAGSGAPAGGPPGGLGGLGGLGALLNNPNLMGMAAQMMQNPAFQNLAQNILANPGGMSELSELANDPNIRNFASQLHQQPEDGSGGDANPSS